MLYNLALEKAVRDILDLKQMEIIGPYTLFANADDVILLGESKYDVEESARKLIKSGFNMGLVINENKTKYMLMTRNATVKGNLCTEGLTFEQVGNFKYLGVNINEKNNMYNEIWIRLNAANRCYFTMKKRFHQSYCPDVQRGAYTVRKSDPW